jgi:hypothetical protein
MKLEFSASSYQFLHNMRMLEPKLWPWAEPPAMDTGAPRPAIHSDGGDLLCGYFMNSTVTSKSPVALLKFENVLQYRFGYPNDEVLQGHSLHQFGLKHYGFFEVENSPLIREIENQNRCHPEHRLGIYAKFRHWVITFHDETLEVIAQRVTVMAQTELSPDRAVCQACTESKKSLSPSKPFVR